MTETEQAQRNRDRVRALYEASFSGDASAFSDAMLEDFEAHVPPVLPWGGVQHGPEAFLTNVLPQLAAAVDFASMRLVSISADGDHVALAQDRGPDPDPVDEGAIDAVRVADLGAYRRRSQDRVTA